MVPRRHMSGGMGPESWLVETSMKSNFDHRPRFLGSSPERLLLYSERLTRSLNSSPSSAGTFPEKPLKKSCSDTSFVRVRISDSPPVSLLADASKYWSFVIFPNPGGRGPVRLLLYSSSDRRLTSFAMDAGIDPVRWLSASSRSVSLVRLPMEEGISPAMLAAER